MRLSIRMGISALLLGACASNDTADTVYDPCSPLTVAIAPTSTADETNGVDAALAGWAAQLPTQSTLVLDAVTQAPDRLPILFEHGGGVRAAYWDQVGTITVNIDALTSADLPAAIAHEIGHAFGLLHISDRVSVMNIGNTTVMPTPDDAADVAALWPSCGP